MMRIYQSKKIELMGQNGCLDVKEGLKGAGTNGDTTFQGWTMAYIDEWTRKINNYTIKN